MKGPEALRALAADGLRIAARAGAQECETFVVERRAMSVASQGRLVFPSESLEEGVGVRVLVDGRTGDSSAGSFAELAGAVRRAVETARRAGADARSWALPAPARPAATFGPHPGLVDADADRATAAAERVATRLLERPGVTYASVALHSTLRCFAVANSRGLEAYCATAGERLEVEARLTRGTTERTVRTSWTGVLPCDRAVDLDAFGQAALDDAERALVHERLASTVETVLLAPAPLSQLLGVFATALSGQSAATGQSPLAGRVGTPVHAPVVTLRDAPHGPVGRNHRAVDDEGVPTKPLTIVEKGVLRALLYDASAAASAGVEPTGHAVREGLTALSVAPANLVLEAAGAPVRDLVGAAERAVLVTQPLLGVFVANRVTGDFSLVAPFAFYVEDGRIRHALPPTTVGGNVHVMLRAARAVGAEAETYLPATTPGILAGGVSCAT